jgi:hypothetical protein
LKASLQITILPPPVVFSGAPQLPSSALTASSSKSHSRADMGCVEGMMMSTAPFAMLVIEGGVTRVKLRTVGCIENGLIPLPGVSNRWPTCQLALLWRNRGGQGDSTHCTEEAGPALTSILTSTTPFTGGVGYPAGSELYSSSVALSTAPAKECASTSAVGCIV